MNRDGSSSPDVAHAATRPPAAANRALAGRRITLCVSGSIAAYKACELTRLLIKQGASVRVIMTRSAQRFVGSATFAAITQQPVLTEMFGESGLGESHVTLSSQSDLVVIAPATADLLARLAQGRADDLVTATALCASCPLLVAPAMHPSMWSHPATQRNVKLLRTDGRVIFVGPVEGEVASGDVGLGRFADPELIVHGVLAALAPRDFLGKHVVVTAGPTVEDIDPVRFMSNRSSGKMGYAIAHDAALRGAQVTLISGPVDLPCPPEVTRVDVRSALEMQTALRQYLGTELDQADLLVMAAAVSDFRYSKVHTAKIKRQESSAFPPLQENPDILAEIGAQRSGVSPLLIGFAVETDAQQLVALARKKLMTKRVDAMVANLAADSLGLDDNQVTIVTAERDERLPLLPKSEVAARVLDWAATAMSEWR
jgi:phosphopantothenoylcysteine decarboxylase / phosphopantothenate---cysteine ligase